MNDKSSRRKNGTFVKGAVGNPAGRPKGARHKSTLAAEALLDGQAEQLTQKAVDMALEGDTTALRLCVERLLPPRKDRPVTVALPSLEGAAGVSEAIGSVVQAVGRGELTPSEGQAIVALYEQHRRSLETEDMFRRIEALEGKAA